MKTIIYPECDFDDYFDEHTKWKGYDYYQRGLVTNINQNQDNYYAMVNNYEVSFKYENGDITEMKCSCPLFSKGVKCKHLYAFIFQIFGQEKEETKYTEEEFSYTKPVEEKKVMNKAKNFVNALNNFNHFFREDEEKEEEKKRIELEEEMDIYGLEDDEKELVRNGEWEPWQFETDPDDLEEEDYYHDDDF